MEKRTWTEKGIALLEFAQMPLRVMPGLDPGIHWTKPQVKPYARLDLSNGLMDGRVKPGHDEL